MNSYTKDFLLIFKTDINGSVEELIKINCDKFELTQMTIFEVAYFELFNKHKFVLTKTPNIDRKLTNTELSRNEIILFPCEIKFPFQVSVFGLNQVSTVNLFFDFGKTIQDNLILYLSEKFPSFKSFQTSFVIVNSSKEDLLSVNEDEINVCVHKLDKKKTRLVLKNFVPPITDVKVLQEKFTGENVSYIEKDCRIVRKSTLQILQLAHKWIQFLPEILYFDFVDLEQKEKNNKTIITLTNRIVIEYEKKTNDNNVLKTLSKSMNIMNDYPNDETEKTITRIISFISTCRIKDVIDKIKMFGPEDLRNSLNYSLKRNGDLVNINDFCGNFLFFKVEFY